MTGIPHGAEMGRTLAPYSMQIESIENRLKDFRKTLQSADKAAFDSIFRAAKLQMQAGVMASNPNPYDSIALAAIVEHERRLDDQARDIRELHDQLTLLHKEFSVIRSMAV